MKVLGVIPSRYQSTRFPGKPLADIMGKSMISRVYEQASKADSVDELIVATDDERIASHVRGFGGKVMMTSENHTNGTSRCLEVLETINKMGKEFDIVVNIQGDEPFIQPEQIDQLVNIFSDGVTEIASLASKITSKKDLFDPNVVKVVMNPKGNALYFSRQTIPFLRGIAQETWLERGLFYKHIGIYAYKSIILKKINDLTPTPLEEFEKLEQLRWLENNMVIRLGITDYKGVGIDTPEDIAKLINNSCD
ncbi:MAG: 3-deoxy-manno-octulosonate cytidylyltransferase [Bacteroidales bacterium]|nr:3-deoxy-manno-octulosonate cytidylyltransferase [Bacteroidales bacterium]